MTTSIRRLNKAKRIRPFAKRCTGKDLCQHGMADMTQIELMLRMLDLRCSSRLVEPLLRVTATDEIDASLPLDEVVQKFECIVDSNYSGKTG
jgi:hypothetical protein